MPAISLGVEPPGPFLAGFPRRVRTRLAEEGTWLWNDGDFCPH